MKFTKIFAIACVAALFVACVQETPVDKAVKAINEFTEKVQACQSFDEVMQVAEAAETELGSLETLFDGLSEADSTEAVAKLQPAVEAMEAAMEAKIAEFMPAAGDDVEEFTEDEEVEDVEEYVED